MNQSAVEAATKPLFADYYPWYGIRGTSYWRHWNDAGHSPDNTLPNGRRDIASKDYPLSDVYDSNSMNVFQTHITLAKAAGIDSFVVSWWGIGSFEDTALAQMKNVFEQNNFNFTIYYENTGDANSVSNDIKWVLDNYATSKSWYKINDRPVIFIYSRSRFSLDPNITWWTMSDNGGQHWSPYEARRTPPRYGIFVIPPSPSATAYVESKNSIYLPSGETYKLNVSISDEANDCTISDVGFNIKIKEENGNWAVLDNKVVNYNQGWVDLSYDISSYAGKKVLIGVGSYVYGDYCSEWAAVDYLLIKNSKGEIINKDQSPYFDSEWKTVVDKLHQMKYNPFLIMDFGGYENKVQYFAEYFFNFMDGIHAYNPTSFSIADISNIYLTASNAAKSKNKVFLATLVPGYDDTAIRQPGFAVNRNNGLYYNSTICAAKKSDPSGYIITSFNEWHEGTEIEPSLDYQDLYIKLTYLNNDDACIYCSDTDSDSYGNPNIFAQGTISGAFKSATGYTRYSYTDSCSGSNVIEYDCNGRDSKSSTINCGTGYICSGGRCTVPSTRCPILNAWNGQEFKEIELLNIHAPKGQDTTYTSTFSMESKYGKYELILHEAAYKFWDGSHINSVKLVDSSGEECHLISAVHSKQGDVLQDLLYSDDKRVRTYPEEEIKLVYDGCIGTDFTFTIEGYNRKCGPYECGYFIFGYPLILIAPIISFVFVLLMVALYLLILSLLEKYNII